MNACTTPDFRIDARRPGVALSTLSLRLPLGLLRLRLLRASA